jgi:hypothetical protein
LKDHYVALEKELNVLRFERGKDSDELSRMEYRTENIKEQLKPVERWKRQAMECQGIRQNLCMWDLAQKKELDEEIVQAKRELAKAQDVFIHSFHIDPSQAQDEIRRVQKEISVKEGDIAVKTARIEEITKKQADIELAYHTQKLFADARPDKEQIEKLLQKLSNPPENVRDRLLYERVNHRLNTIADENLQKVLENLPPEQAKFLTDKLEKSKVRELEKAIEQDRSPSHGRDR